jgi:hypothetical protein
VANYIMALATTPKGLGRVTAIAPAADRQSVILIADNGQTVAAPLDLNFLEPDTTDHHP